MIYECVVTTNSSGDATSSTFTANATTGSYNVTAGASGTGTVNFALSNVGDVLVITSARVSGATSGTANLGPITVQQQTTGGTPVAAGSGGQTVQLQEIHGSAVCGDGDLGSRTNQGQSMDCRGGGKGENAASL